MTRWFRNNEGVAAVEFVLVGFPFIFMIVGLVEMAMMFTAQSILQDSTFSAARLIRTGQLQQEGSQETVFREAVCDMASLMIPCNKIQFQVETFDDFDEAADVPPVQFDADGNLMAQTFNAGGPEDIVMIRVVYNYRIVTPLMRPFLGSGGGGTRSMISTIFLQSEPYVVPE